MRRFLVSLGIVLVVCVSFFQVQGVRAKQFTTNVCSDPNPCVSYQYWSGNQNGMQVNTTLSNPGLVDTLASWERSFYVFDSIQGHAAVHAGFLKTKDPSGNAQLCNANTSLPYFYSYVVLTNGTIYPFSADCQLAQAGDVNAAVSIQIYEIANGMVVSMTAHSSYFYRAYTNLSGLETTYNRIQYYHEIEDSISNHKMWGVSDVYSKYFQYSSGAFTFQHRNSDWGPVSNNVAGQPKMYWRDVPTTTNNGGRLENCIYESYGNPACTDGS